MSSVLYIYNTFKVYLNAFEKFVPPLLNVKVLILMELGFSYYFSIIAESLKFIIVTLLFEFLLVISLQAYFRDSIKSIHLYPFIEPFF